MSESISPISNANQTAAIVANNGKTGKTATDSPELTSNSKVSSLADLRKKSPKVYNMMLQGIAINICNKMKDHQDHLKQMMDESRRNG